MAKSKAHSYSSLKNFIDALAKRITQICVTAEV